MIQHIRGEHSYFVGQRNADCYMGWKDWTEPAPLPPNVSRLRPALLSGRSSWALLKRYFAVWYEYKRCWWIKGRAFPDGSYLWGCVFWNLTVNHCLCFGKWERQVHIHFLHMEGSIQVLVCSPITVIHGLFHQLVYLTEKWTYQFM